MQWNKNTENITTFESKKKMNKTMKSERVEQAIWAKQEKHEA